MGDLAPELRRGSPGDQIVYLYNGAGTSAYERPPSIESVCERFPAPHGERYRYVTVAGWSAGGRGVQRLLDGALDPGARIPNAAILVDGLYAPRLVSGGPDLRPLDSVIRYAILAAGNMGGAEHGPILVLTCSQIATPYASSSECVAAVVAAVEARLGKPIDAFDPGRLDGRPVQRARRCGGLIVLEYAGRGATEHVAEAHEIDELVQAFIPWSTPDCRTMADGVACFPDVVLANPSAIPNGSPGSNDPGSPDGSSPAVQHPVDTGDREGTDPYLEALVSVALEDVGQRETDGPNRSPWIDSLADHGEPLGASYCARAVRHWLRKAALRIGQDKPPIPGSQLAKAYVAQLQLRHAWYPRADLARHICPGMILVWDRGTPSAPWQGHIGVVRSVERKANGAIIAHVIEANTTGPQGEGCYEVVESLGDPRLLGGGCP